jgi:hypothetical protein
MSLIKRPNSNNWYYGAKCPSRCGYNYPGVLYALGVSFNIMTVARCCSGCSRLGTLVLNVRGRVRLCGKFTQPTASYYPSD